MRYPVSETNKTTPLITISDVSFRYTYHWVLEHINLTIYTHDFLAIIGPNGGGKTTLIKLILGLLKPTHGSITYSPDYLSNPGDQIGYVPQTSHFDIHFPITVEEVVLMGLLGRKKKWVGYNKQDKKRVEEALELVDLQDKRQVTIHALSGGQLQRVMIARSLVVEPHVLILDEPTSFIDKEIESSLSDLLKSWHKRMSIILVTHDIGFVHESVKHLACVNHRLTYHEKGNLTNTTIENLYGGQVNRVDYMQMNK